MRSALKVAEDELEHWNDPSFWARARGARRSVIALKRRFEGAIVVDFERCIGLSRASPDG